MTDHLRLLVIISESHSWQAEFSLLLWKCLSPGSKKERISRSLSHILSQIQAETRITALLLLRADWEPQSTFPHAQPPGTVERERPWEESGILPPQTPQTLRTSHSPQIPGCTYEMQYFSSTKLWSETVLDLYLSIHQASCGGLLKLNLPNHSTHVDKWGRPLTPASSYIEGFI